MQPHADTETHRTPEVEPAIKHTVPWRVKSVTALPDARLQVVFVDGTTGEVHMKQFLSDSKLNGTIFGSLRDPAIFAQAQVVLGAVQWPNGADCHARCDV
jgi:16S rRNA C1402 N4-methylase RsmH